MTHCGEKWVNMVEKTPEICTMSENYRRRVDYWIGICDDIIKRGFDRNLVFKRFPEGAARELKKAGNDAVREKALNYICSQLKRGETVTAPALKNEIKQYEGGDSPTSCPVVKRVPNGTPPTPEIDVKPKKPGYVGCYQPGEIKTTNDPPQPSLAQQQANKGAAAEPAPAKPRIPACTRGGTCPKMITDGTRGKVCDMLGVPVNQLPASGCPFDSAKGFTPASRLDAAKPLVERPAYKIVPVQLSKQEAEAAIKSVVRGYLTKAQQGIWEDIRKSGECGDTDLEIFEAMIDRMGAA